MKMNNNDRGSNASSGVDGARTAGETPAPASPRQIEWQRHDHDDGVISYEIWETAPSYGFLFHIYEAPFVDDAKRLAGQLVTAMNSHRDLLEALKELRSAVFDLGPHWNEPATDHLPKWQRLNDAQHRAGVLLYGPDDPQAGPDIAARLPASRGEATP